MDLRRQLKVTKEAFASQEHIHCSYLPADDAAELLLQANNENCDEWLFGFSDYRRLVSLRHQEMRVGVFVYICQSEFALGF